MLTQPMPVPIMLDTREALQIDKKSSPNLRGVRSSEGKLVHGPGTTFIMSTPAPSGPLGNIIRNIQHTDLEAITGLFVLGTERANWKNEVTGVETTLSDTYTFNAVDTRWLRFAVVSSLGLLAWTGYNEGYTAAVQALRVRTMNSALTITPIPSDYAGTHMIALQDRLLIGKTVEAGVVHPYRLRWCVNGNFQDWTGIGSGFLDVTNEYPGRPILGLMPLTGKAYVSLDREILEIVPTGSPSPAFVLEKRILGTGMMAGNSWAATEYFGFFLGNDAQVYRWDGANLTTVSEPIHKTLTAALRTIPATEGFPFNQRRVVQGAINLADQEYWLLIDEGPDRMFIYDYRRDRWYRDHFGDYTITAIGAARRQAFSRYGTVFLGHHDHTVAVVTPDTILHQSTNVTRYVETPDYTAQEIRAGQLIPTLGWRNTAYAFRFRWTGGSSVEVGYSTNKGATWTTQNVTVDTSDGVCVVWILADFNQIRFRLKVTSGTFGLSDLLSYDWEKNGVQL
jgi:hypothetical protein